MATFNATVAASADDAHSFADGASASITNVLVRCDSGATDGARYVGGVRFPNVTIPAGATINSAYITCTPANTSVDDVLAHIFCDDEDSAAAFATTTPNRPMDRPKTTANTAWSATGLGTSPVNSPDFAAAVQEVIDRAGWASGNALAVLIDGDLSGTVRSFRPFSYDTGPGTDPVDITIDYTPPAGGPAVGTLALMGAGR